MILNYGGFKFKWDRVSSVSLSTDFGIAKNDRLNNTPSFFATAKPHTSLKIEASTLPLRDGNTSLNALYALATTAKAYALTAGNGRYLGRFVITKIDENRSTFISSGGFLAQSFTLELERVE